MKMLKITEAASILCVSRKTLANLANGGKISFYRPSPKGKYYFKREWLDEYIKRNTAKPV